LTQFTLLYHVIHACLKLKANAYGVTV